MRIDIQAWMAQYLRTIKDLFGGRLVFVGLQGSYGRGEATATSDIDVVIILDAVTLPDLKDYDQAISHLPHRDKVCGFISGEQELLCWDRSELFQFYHDTTPLLGSIDRLAKRVGEQDVRRAIVVGAGAVYHMCGHNIVHEKSLDVLKAAYKTAGFVLRAVHYHRTGVYIKKEAELRRALPPREQEVLRGAAELGAQPQLRGSDVDRLAGQLFAWAGALLREYGKDT